MDIQKHTRFKLGFITILILYSFFLFAQKIDKVEYFLGNDPGVGNGVNVPVTAAEDVKDLNFSFSTDSLPPGFHKLSIRSRDSLHKWSLTHEFFFFLDTVPAGSQKSLALINGYEYFIDTDPGFGNGTTMSFGPVRDTANLIFTIDISVLTKGFHWLGYRTRDNSKNWSSTRSHSFFIESIPPGQIDFPSNITNYEFFFDTDPGFGNGDVTSIGPVSDTANVIFSIDADTLPSGFHWLGFRTKDSGGKWSITKSYPLFLERIPSGSTQTSSDIVSFEFFFDTDPGFGNGNVTNIGPVSDSANVIFDIDITSLVSGFHWLSFRTKDSAGKWSLCKNHFFFIEDIPVGPAKNPVNLDEFESYINTEPGFGNGVGILTPDSAELNNFTFEHCMAGRLPDTYTIIFRTKNESGKWSMTHMREIEYIGDCCKAKDITVYLDESGQVVVDPNLVDNGSNICNSQSLSLSADTFSCSDAGMSRPSVLTATDSMGHSCDCSPINITVLDTIKPDCRVNNFTIYLDSTGNTAITVDDVNNNSTDACGIDTVFINKNSFGCVDTGYNEVTLTVTDVHNNTSHCIANIIVVDTIAPSALCKNLDVTLDSTGSAQITPPMANSGSSDACGIASLVLDQTTFSCSDIPAVNVQLTVTDNNGNSSICISSVTVQDTTAPVAMCKNIAVNLDSIGIASILPSSINNGSYDSCGITSLNLDTSSFECSDVGPNLVKLTVTDVNGNSSNCMSTITVQDVTPPVVMCKSYYEVALDISGSAVINATQIDTGTTDACGIDSVALNKDTFGCGDPDTNTVILRAWDSNGNSDFCQSNIIITDPLIACCYEELYVGLDTIPSREYIADKIIRSDKIVPANGNVIFDAGQKILLETGFHVLSGGIFHAYIGEGCPGVVRKSDPKNK